MKAETVSIIGLDRISGSIGLVLRNSSLGLTVIGYSDDPDISNTAKELNVVDRIMRKMVKAAAEADIVILNTSLRQQEETIQLIGDVVKDHALIIDLTSLKGPGIRWAKEYLQQGHYVGVSPVLSADLLADSSRDIEAATVNLFKDSVFCIMPSPSADPDAVQTTVNLGRLLGATPFFLDADEYDSLVHGIATIPGLLAGALFGSVKLSTGWRDILRFAGLPFAQATAALDDEDLAELTGHDKEATLRWLDALLSELQSVRRLVADGDEERLTLILEELVFERQKWLVERQRNDWSEGESSSEFANYSLSSQLFGFGRKRKKKKES